MHHFALKIEYDGTNFSGWQRQKDAPSVQEEIEKLLNLIIGEPISLSVAGRTDTGVHALNQVASFSCERDISPKKIRDALNGHFKMNYAKIAIIDVAKTDENFNARFSAKGRTYIYKIINRVSQPAIFSNKAWWIRKRLDVFKMQEAADILIGTHDLTTFRAAACQGKTPIKTISSAQFSCFYNDDNRTPLAIENTKVTNQDSLNPINHPQGIEIIFKINAPSFLHHQVRSIMGALKWVGDGHITVAQFQDILEAKNRKKCPPLAPACGLYLSRIHYGENEVFINLD